MPVEENSSNQREPTMQEICDKVRSDILSVANMVFYAMSNSHFAAEQQYPFEHSEMKANLMLCYRHLEDARMRLGKVLQAMNGGKSIYDK